MPEPGLSTAGEDIIIARQRFPRRKDAAAEVVCTVYDATCIAGYCCLCVAMHDATVPFDET